MVAPLGADRRRVYVATRDGAVTALNRENGSVAWRVEDRPGRLTVAPGRLIVRGPDGTVRSLRPRTGEVRWSTETGLTGPLPATLDADRLYVAGSGMAALDVESGAIIWTERWPVEVTSPAVPTVARVLAGEADGTLRCRDRATGVTLWTHQTAGPLKAPPLVDEKRRRIYVGTTDRRILEVKLDQGRRGWRWKVGADIESPGLLLPDRVLYASFDAVLYGLTRGGNLSWRIPLPSRPLSGPLQVGGHILIACHENEILGFDARTGKPSGSLRTVAEIRTAPLVAGQQLFLGLRNRSVVALTIPLSPVLPPALGGPPPPQTGPDQ